MTKLEERVERLELDDAATGETLKDLLEGQRQVDRKIDGLRHKVNDLQDDVKELKMGVRMVIDRLSGIENKLR